MHLLEKEIGYIRQMVGMVERAITVTSHHAYSKNIHVKLSIVLIDGNCSLRRRSPCRTYGVASVFIISFFHNFKLNHWIFIKKYVVDMLC